MPFVKHLGKTNMLTHIPEDIKLELKDGVLTLKAGSKVYVPNGFEKTKKYYKDVVTTKYWKEITTGSRELEYACYIAEILGTYNYAKAPIGSDMVMYWGPNNGFVKPTDSSQVVNGGYKWKSLSEEGARDTSSSSVYNRSYADDFYIDTTVTETVEGTPEDYTYTTTETETIEVSANDDWTRFEEIDTDVKKFDEVVIESDLSVANVNSTESSFVFYAPSTKVLGYYRTESYSGDTAPTNTSSHVWYDTSNNIVKIYSGANDEYFNFNGSLPLGLVSSTSIDQVFNGFGYIGSTVYALPDVRGLIPNGFNADGSLNSIEFAVDSVLTRTYSSSTGTYVLRIHDGDAIYATSSVVYKPEENLIYVQDSVYTSAVVGEVVYSSGTVTSLTPKKVGEGIIKNKLYQLAANKRTYYKYQYQDFVQPKLTANGTLGGKSFAVAVDSRYDDYSAYKAFDGDTSTSWQSNGTTAAGTYFKMYNPNPLNITKIVWSGTPKYGTITAGIVYGSNDDIDYVELATFSGGTTSGGTMDLSSNTNYYKYYKITPTTWTDKSGTYTNGWAELTITAQEQIAVEVNLNGEDVYEDWKQPALTANTTAVKGGNIVVTCSSEYGADWFGYKSMDGTDTTNWATAARVYSGWLKVVFPYKLKISNLNIKTRGANTFEVYDAENGNLITSGGAESKNTPIDYPVNNVLTDTLYFTVSGEETVGLQEVKITAQKLAKVGGTVEDADYYTEKLLSYAPIVRGSRTYYKQDLKQRDTGTYTFTLNKDYTAKMLFVGNGGGGCSSQKDSRWHYSSGGSGAVFEGLVRLPADTYTLTIGSLGYGNNRDNVHYHSSSVVSSPSYLTNSAGEELIRVGAGGNGYTSVGGVGGAAGVLTLGTLDVLETKKATDGVYTAGNTSAGSVSAYDGTYSGYGAGTGAQRGQGNVYGIKGIFDLVLETDINDYTYYEDIGTKIY
jgi:hypothetical protein